MQKGSGTRLELPGLTVHPIEVGTTPAARLDWTLAIEDDQGPLRLVSEYDLARYDQQMIVEMLVAYQSILSRIVADPQQRLQDLCISDPGSAGPGFDAARSQTVVSHVLDPIRTNSH
jgi:non-ribosomal peptide synthetase component F